MAHEVHLVGSVPRTDAEHVFTTVASVLGNSIKRIPDGETGECLSWVGWLGSVFARMPELVYRMKCGVFL